MGMATRLDVELQAVKGIGSRKGPETFTDLDVLGVSISPDARASTVIADCKTTRRESTSRMFWIAGVSGFVNADHAYLVREHDVTEAARQLSSKLGIGILTSSELGILQKIHENEKFSSNPNLSFMFDRGEVERHLRSYTQLAKKLDPLLKFRNFDYWINDDYRNISVLINRLKDSAATLDSSNSIHRSLFFDVCWLFLLTLIKACGYVRSGYLVDVPRAMQEYIFGGAAGFREKETMAEYLNKARPAGVPEQSALPTYFRPLVELVVRLLNRPGRMTESLRYLEIVSASSLKSELGSLPILAGEDLFDSIAAKLSADVCGFLVSACNLDPGFRSHARSEILGEVANGRGNRENLFEWDNVGEIEVSFERAKTFGDDLDVGQEAIIQRSDLPPSTGQAGS